MSYAPRHHIKHTTPVGQILTSRLAPLFPDHSLTSPASLPGGMDWAPASVLVSPPSSGRTACCPSDGTSRTIPANAGRRSGRFSHPLHNLRVESIGTFPGLSYLSEQSAGVLSTRMTCIGSCITMAYRQGKDDAVSHPATGGKGHAK